MEDLCKQEAVSEVITLKEADEVDKVDEEITLQLEVPEESEVSRDLEIPQAKEFIEEVAMEFEIPQEETTEEDLWKGKAPTEVSLIQEASEAPHFQHPLENQELTEGEIAVFEVQVSGSPKPQVSW